MNKLLIGTLATLLFTPTVLAQDLDGKKPLICANVEISECVPDGECEAVSAASISASNLLKVDFKKKLVAGVGKAASRPATAIETQEITNGRIYLQGVDTDKETGRGLAWTMIINQDNGHMTLTASSDDVVFNVFGSCTAI